MSDHQQATTDVYAEPSNVRTITASCAGDSGCTCGGGGKSGCSCGGGGNKSNSGSVAPSGYGSVVPALAGGGPLVYALGSIFYDFGTEARKDYFMQAMGGRSIDQYFLGTPIPTVPPVPPITIPGHPEEEPDVIWLLTLDTTPIYAIAPEGPYAKETYDKLVQILQAQSTPPKDPCHVEIVSIPGRITGQVTLLSGQTVPVLTPSPRGLCAWTIDQLIDLFMNKYGSVANRTDLEDALRKFLNRVYWEWRNLGLAPQHRALNYCAANIFQAGICFLDVIKKSPQPQLASIQVDQSSICRPGQECWDVKLIFFDPNNTYSGRDVVRFTIDVSDVVPVALGEPRGWTTCTS